MSTLRKVLLTMSAAAGTMVVSSDLVSGHTLTVGVESDFPLIFLGSYAPGGMFSLSVATYSDLLGFRANLGGICACQPHLALSLEGSGATSMALGRGWTFSPHVGLAIAKSTPYQRMTNESRVGPNGEHLDTYLYAEKASSHQVFAGTRFTKFLGTMQALSLGIGLLHEYKFDADNLERREIRNCYADNCPDSDKSGGGDWPDPKNAYYLTVSYELDVVGTRR